jgi:hypothetical protein
MAATLLSLFTVAAVVQAQVTNVIYQDSFARTGVLNGTSPDTVDATGATWIANTLVNQIVTDGSEVAFTNTVIAGTPYNNAFLPLTIEIGHIYTLMASLLANTNYGNNWMALGYSITPTMIQGFNASSTGCGWVLHRSTNAPGNGSSGNFQCYLGPNTGGGTTYGFGNAAYTTNFTTYNIVLNTAANPTNWTVAFYTNGALVTTKTYPAPAPKGNNNVPMAYVGFSSIGLQGYVRNFSVTDVVPTTVAPSIVEAPQNVTAQQGHTATFWVNAAGLPDPAYQWLSNNVAIAGATNATYTTPPLSIASYNNVQYSVTVSNVAGSVPGGTGTLTVTAGQPTIFSATKTANGTNIVVAFSGPVDRITGLNAANYSLTSASVVSANYASSLSNSVVLTTTTLNTNAAYYLTVANVQDLFGDVITGTTVPVLPAGLVLYLRGDSGVVLDANSLVVSWLDQTTNGNNARQYFGEKNPDAPIPGPAARPSPSFIAPNSLPAINFNNATNVSTNFITSPATPSLAIDTNLTIIAVANVNFSSITGDVINKGIGNLPGSYDYQINGNNSGTATIQSGSASGNNAGSSSTVKPSAGNTHEWAVTRAVTGLSSAGAQSNLVSHFLDGNAAGSSYAVIGAPGCADVHNQPIYIGGRSDQYFSARLNGQLGEIMLFNSALSGADRTNVDNYLGAKYFPLTISQQPSSATTNEGDTATFTVAASQGSAHLSYQWQVESNGSSSFVNISGATNASYTTPILAPGDNNDQFDVQIIVPGNSTNTSSAATVTVNPLPPTVSSAGTPIWNQTNIIVVLFSEAVDPVTATTVANYSLNNGASVLSAAIGDAPNKVVLTTSALTPGVVYTLTVQNVKNIYNVIMSPVSPSVGVYPPYTALWIKAGTGVTADANGNVSQWNDLSGNTNNMIQPAGPPFTPVLATNAFGDPVIRFTGSNETYMYANDSSTLEITGDMSIFAVVNFATLAGGTNGEIVSKTCANIAAPFDYYVDASSARLYRGNCATYGIVASTNPPPTGILQLIDVVMQGTTVSHRLDGDTNGGGTLSTTIGDTQQPVYIGTRADAHNRLTGDLAELIVIASALSSNDVASMENYLAISHHLSTPGAPQIVRNPQTPFLVWPGYAAVNTVSALGTQPFYYQWQFGGSNLSDNSRITGSHSSNLTIANAQTSDAGNYQVIVTNVDGAATSSLAMLIIDSEVSFDVTGLGWAANGSAQVTGSNVVTLTSPSGLGGNGGFFFQYPQYIGAFDASFTYQAGGNMAADGVTFCLQDDPRGTAALGSAGGGLGVGNGGLITPSVELELNIYTNNGVGGEGYSFNTNGTIGPTTAPGSVVLAGGDPINVTVNYALGRLSLLFTDAVASTSFSTNLYVGDLTALLGTNSAYVGFTGAYGGSTAIQTISNFTFLSIPLAGIQLLNGSDAVIYWPGAAAGYVVQQNPSLTTTNWANVTNAQILTNGLNQVTVPATASNMFYRLIYTP